METEMHGNNGGGVIKKERRELDNKPNYYRKSEVSLRVLALILTLIAAILMGINKQTKMVSVIISPDLPPFLVAATAKYNYQSAFVYFVVGNSIASVCAAISLIDALSRKSGSALMRIMMMDLIMVALMFSCIGATGAVGLLGMKGNSHLMWKKVCNVYGKFCHQVTAALILSFLGGVAYLFLVFIDALRLKRTN